VIARWATVALLAMAMAACGHETNKDYAAMNKMPMHTVCVGRMLVELPKGGQMDWQQQFDHATVDRLPLSINTSSMFWTFVDKRKTELEQPTKARPQGTLGIYKKVGDNAVIMQFRDAEIADLQGYYTERYLWLGSWGYKYKTGGVYDNQAAELLAQVENTIKQVEPIDNFQPPQGLGFCIDGALVTGKIGPIWSGVSSSIKGWKRVSVNVGASEDDGTRIKFSWEKVSHPLPMPTPFDDLEMFKSWAGESKRSSDDDRVVSFEVLRKENRQLMGMPGEEIAIKAELANGQEWYRFEWNSLDDATRPLKSGFSFGLEAGDKDYTPDYVPPPPQEDLLALWDVMLASLKPRPSAR